jgi:single-strand DNA-binding protein
VNSVNLVGRVGYVSELQASVAGALVLRVRVATDDAYVDRSGDRKSRTNWHTVKVFDQVASALSKRLVAGQIVSVQGRLVTWTPEGPNGAGERQEIEAFRLVALPGPKAAKTTDVNRDASCKPEGG